MQYNIDQLKRIPIATILEAFGYVPKQEHKNGSLVYLSPFRDEKTPSFHVNTIKNVFKDFGGGDELGGDVIRLFMLLKKCDFKDACSQLAHIGGEIPIQNSFSFNGNKALTENTLPQQAILQIKTIQHPALTGYIQERGIDVDLIRLYCEEIHYTNIGKRYFAICFKNDVGGYDLRNSLYKGKIGSNGVTTLPSVENGSTALFEGFFSYLSALQYYGLNRLKENVIVLNSINNYSHAKKQLEQSSKISSHLDNDPPGQEVFNKMQKQHLTKHIENTAHLLYPNHKDFNTFLTAHILNVKNTSTM